MLVDPDDLMSEMYTDEEGRFDLRGSEYEIFGIDVSEVKKFN